MAIIGISLQFQDSYDSAVARGIIAYAKKRTNWVLRGSGGGLRPLHFSGKDRCDAIIARIEDAQEATRLASLGIIVIDIAGAHSKKEIHRVQNDDFATGCQAGTYVRNLGAATFAFCGVHQVHWSRQRLLGFVKATGSIIDAIPRFERSLSWWQQPTSSHLLHSFVQDLPVGTALFCCNDSVGVKVAAHCSDISKHIPSEIALLGVDDEDLLCSLCLPSLSSVRLDCFAIGLKAAQVVDELLHLNDTRVSQRIISIAPREVVERESTSIILEDDPIVASALRYIRSAAGAPLKVEQISHACNVSRRTLEKHMKRVRNTTVLQEITQFRLQRAQYLLRHTDLTIESIAKECGISSAERLHVLFSTSFAISCGRYRKQAKVHNF